MGIHAAILALFSYLLFFIFLPSGSRGKLIGEEVSAATNIKPPIEAPAQTAVASFGKPKILKIPRIKVSARVDSVGVAKDGSMGVPIVPKNVAWFKLGPRPGEVGSAVISGHVNWWTGAVGSFANLNKLKPGDKILVQDENGQEISFVVRLSKNYNAAADATDIFTSKDGKAHLNLITCSGVWNKNAKQYTQRLVVFADKEE